MELEEYSERFKTAEVSRDDGVLTIRMHSRGGPLMWGGLPHQELPELFNAIASDRENRVVILTGTGDTFIGLPEGANPLLKLVWLMRDLDCSERRAVVEASFDHR